MNTLILTLLLSTGSFIDTSILENSTGSAVPYGCQFGVHLDTTDQFYKLDGGMCTAIPYLRSREPKQYDIYGVCCSGECRTLTNRDIDRAKTLQKSHYFTILPKSEDMTRGLKEIRSHLSPR